MLSPRARTVPTLFLLALLLAASAAAQQVTGSVRGIVADSSRAVLPGVLVELAALDTGLVASQTSGPDGVFVFNAVKPGSYRLTTALEGFKSVAKDLLVAVNATTQADLTLEVGNLQEVVVVTAPSAAVELAKAQVATNVDSKTITDLPNINRDITQLVELMPGARQVLGSTSGGSQVVDISGNYAVGNGTRRSQSLFYLDGSENMGSRRNQALQMPNPDTIEEVQIVSSSASAEFGKEPGISVNAITKSGTNQFRGTAFYAWHDERFNANTWAANRAGSPKAKDDQKWYGGTIGGPIRRNRTFFFGSYQRYQDNQAVQQNSARMPTPRMVNGDFSEIPGFSIRAIDPATGQPIGAVIPASLMHPVAANLKARLPTIDAYNNTLRYFWTTSRDVFNNEYLGKVDHKISDRHQIAGSYMGTLGEQTRPDGFPGLENQVPGWGGTAFSDAMQHTASLRHVWIPTNTTVVENRVALGYLASNRSRTELGENLGTIGGRWPEVTAGVEKTLPSVFFSGGPNIRGGQLSDTTQKNLRVLSTMNWLKGSHNLKFGGELQRSGFTRFLNYDNGQLFFTGTYAFTAAPINGPWPVLSSPSGDLQFAYAWADFLMGRVNRANATGVSDNDMSGLASFFFVQDEWRIGRRLTLTPGLRYELYGAQTSKALLAGYVEGHRSSQYANAPIGLAFEGDAGIADGFRSPDRNNFAPRVGVAWDILGDGRLALRAGGGLYYAYPPLAMLEVLADTIGATTITANNGNLSDPWGTARANSGDTACQFPNCQPPSFSSDPSLRTFVPTSINGFTDDLDTPYQYQFNATLQWRALDPLLVEGGYVGNRGKRGFIVLDDNLAVWTPTASEGNVNARRPNQLWRAINIVSNQAIERYDAAQFTATYRRKGWYGRLTYTLQRTLSTGDDEGQEVGISNTPALWTDNPRDLEGELAPVTPRQVLRAAFAVDLPRYERHGLLDAVAGGWQVAGNLSWNDGERLNVTIGRDHNVDGFAGDRPDLSGGIGYERTDNGDGTFTWINRNGLTLPAVPSAENPYPFGTLTRNAVRGPGRVYADMALTKYVPIRGRLRLQLRMDATNIFNHPLLNNPNMNLSSADFGLIRTRFGTPRTIQVQTKLIF